MKLAHDIISVAIMDETTQQYRYLIGRIASESYRVIDASSWHDILSHTFEQVHPEILKDLLSKGFLKDEDVSDPRPLPLKRDYALDWEANEEWVEELAVQANDKNVRRIFLKADTGNFRKLSAVLNAAIPIMPQVNFGKIRICYEVAEKDDRSILEFADSLPKARGRRICILPFFPGNLLVDDEAVQGFASFELDLLMDLDTKGIPINLFEVVNERTTQCNMVDRMLLAYSLNGTELVREETAP